MKDNSKSMAKLPNTEGGGVSELRKWLPFKKPTKCLRGYYDEMLSVFHCPRALIPGMGVVRAIVEGMPVGAGVSVWHTVSGTVPGVVGTRGRHERAGGAKA